MKKLTVFDLDETLVHGDTSVIWRQYLQEIKVITDPNYAKKDNDYMQQYADGTLDLADYLHFSLSPIANTPIEQVNAWLADCVHNHVVQHIFPEAKTLIKELTADNDGEDMLIISATVTFIVKAVANELGIKNAIGVDVAVENNAYTHHVVGTPSFREGKVIRLKQWLTENGKHNVYDHVVFYTDSINDLPLCEFADEVFTVNPCRQLHPIAEQRGWGILPWGHSQAG